MGKNAGLFRALAAGAAFAGTVAVAAVAPARADIVWASPQVGLWRVYADRGNGGTSCYMTSLGERGGVLYAILPGPRQLMVVRHDSWDIPEGASARIVMQVDGYTRWNTTVRRTERRDTLAMESDFDEAAVRFLIEFREGDVLTLFFPNGQRFTVNLTGTKAATDYLTYCNRAYVEGESGRRNPFGN